MQGTASERNAFTFGQRVARHLSPIGFLWLVGVVLWWPLLTPFAEGREFILDGDFTRQFFQYHSFAASELLSGRLPTWNPFIVGGHPFIADIQTAVFYPPGLVANFVLGSGGLGLAEMQYRAVGNYFLAALFAYLLGYQLTGRRPAAMVTALVFAYGGFLTSYPLQQLPILETAVWLPLQLLLVDLAAERRFALRWMASCGVAFAMSILAGHPQTVMFNADIIVAYSLYRSACISRDDRLSLPAAARRLASDGLRVLAMFGMAAGIAAVQLVPSIELLLLSNRVEIPYTSASWGYQLSSLVGALVPGWEDGHGLYAGILTLFLAATAAFGRVPGTGFWLATSLATLLLSTGGNGPLYPLFHALAPGFALFRSQERIALVYSLAVAILAGKGLASLTAPRSSPPSRYLAAGTFAAAVLAVAIALVFASGARGTGPQPWYWYAVGLSGASAGILWLARRTRVDLRIWSGVALGLIALDLLVVNGGSNLTAEASWPKDNVERIAIALEKDIEERAPGAQSRLRVQTADEDAFPVNSGHFTGVQQIGGDTPFFQKRLADLRDADYEWRLWQLLNVRYTVSRRELGPDGLDDLGTFGGLRLYRVQWPVPRVWAARDVRIANSESDALALTLHRDITPGSTVVLQEAPPAYLDGPPPKQENKVVDYGTQRMVIATTLEAPAVVVAADAYYPGWRARVDGVEVKVLRADYYLRGVLVPAGSHTIEYTYEPDSLRVGAVVSVATLLVVLVLVVLAPATRRMLSTKS